MNGTLNGTLKGAIVLGILLGRKESNEQLEALATKIAAGEDTESEEIRLMQLGQGNEGIELISTSVKETVYDRASDGQYKNRLRLNELVKALSLRA